MRNEKYNYRCNPLLMTKEFSGLNALLFETQLH